MAAASGGIRTEAQCLGVALELMAGVAGGLRWVLAEAFIAEFAPPGQTGRYIGAYATMVGLTFVIGPALLAWVGTDNTHALWLVIALLAVPILIQVFFNSALAYWLNKKVGEKHNIACPSALIGASNFFELAVAAAISLFGFHSGAALATVVGVLIEVPVMLLVVRVVNRSRGWYENK